jgi:hypothetical protein
MAPETLETQENRLKSFASFFKGYMSVMPIVTAAVAPVLTLAKAIPVFESEKTTLATYSGLLGFLMVAWVFYARSMFVPAMVPYKSPPRPPASGPIDLKRIESDAEHKRLAHNRQIRTNLYPLALILLSLGCYISYLWAIDIILDDTRRSQAIYSTRAQILETGGIGFSIPWHGYLQVLYLGIFLFAEAAFVVMALREYAYGVLKISEAEVLGRGFGSGAKAVINASAPDSRTEVNF